MSQNLCSYVDDIRLTMSLGVALVGNHLMPHLLHRGKRRIFYYCWAPKFKTRRDRGGRPALEAPTAQPDSVADGAGGDF